MCTYSLYLLQIWYTLGIWILSLIIWMPDKFVNSFCRAHGHTFQPVFKWFYTLGKIILCILQDTLTYHLKTGLVFKWLEHLICGLFRWYSVHVLKMGLNFKLFWNIWIPTILIPTEAIVITNTLAIHLKTTRPTQYYLINETVRLNLTEFAHPWALYIAP